MRLVERIVAVERVLGVVERTHHHAHVAGRRDMGVVRDPDRRRILDRHPRARVDRLGLGKHEGQLFARGLRRRQPLQAGRVGRGGVDDAHLRRMRRRGDGELAAERLVARRQYIVQRRRFAVGRYRRNRGDFQIPRVQHQRRRLRIFPVQFQRRLTAQLTLRKVDPQIEIQMRDANLIRLRVRVGFGRHDGQRQRRCSNGKQGKQTHADSGES